MFFGQLAIRTFKDNKFFHLTNANHLFTRKGKYIRPISGTTKKDHGSAGSSSSGGQPYGPQVTVLQLATSYMNSQIISAIVDLQVADNLKDDTKPVNELATTLGCQSSRTLYRLLRAGASLGLTEEVDFQQHTFKLTPAGQFLRSDHPMSLKNVVQCHMNPTFQIPWRDLAHSVKTGQNAFRKNFGKGLWEFYDNNNEESAIFNKSMSDVSRGNHSAIVQAYDFSSIKMLVDVGGGHGALMTAILTANPTLHGAVFDRTTVVNTETQFVKSEDVYKRLQFHGGNFFENITPSGADAYILSSILHDWGDDDCIRILKNVHKVIQDNGKVLIAERVVVEDNTPSFTKMMDLLMLVLTDGGQERTEKDFRELLPKAGFKLLRVVPAKGMVSVVEGIKV